MALRRAQPVLLYRPERQRGARRSVPRLARRECRREGRSPLAKDISMNIVSTTSTVTVTAAPLGMS